MKSIRVDDETHAQFKAACALRGVNMKSAAIAALRAQIERWKRERETQEREGDDG